MDIQNSGVVSLLDLRVSFVCERNIGSSEPIDELTAWRTKLVLVDEDDETTQTVASAVFWCVGETVSSPIVSLDSVSADLSRFARFFDGDRLSEELELESLSGGLIVAERVTVPSQWRGHGFGPLLLAESLEVLKADASVVVGEPAPFELEGASPEWASEKERLRVLWGRFGFLEWEDGLWYLDLTLATFDETRRELHAGFG